mgnify:CR=1 FL=1
MVAELIDGELFLQPRPAKPHTHTASVLGAQLNVAFQLGRGGPGGWWILYEPEIHFEHQVLVPDLAGWRRDATPSFDTETAYYEETPSWVCEVLSPSTEALDRIKKLRVYHRAGVRHAWLVHPTHRTIEVFRSDPAGLLLAATALGEETVELEPFEALPLELSSLWFPNSAP